VRCVTLMVNRSDRRFQTLSPAMAREAVRLIVERSARKSIKAWASSDARQAGRIYDCNRVPKSRLQFTLARGRGPYMAGGAKWIRTLGTARQLRAGIDRWAAYGPALLEQTRPLSACWPPQRRGMFAAARWPVYKAASLRDGQFDRPLPQERLIVREFRSRSKIGVGRTAARRRGRMYPKAIESYFAPTTVE